MTIREFSQYAETVYTNSSKRSAQDGNGNYYRTLCFGSRSFNHQNAAFGRQVLYLGGFTDPKDHPNHAVDGLRHSNTSLGACSLLNSPSGLNEVYISVRLIGIHSVNKVVIWPTNHPTNQLFNIYTLPYSHTCRNNVLLEYDDTSSSPPPSTKVFCENPRPEKNPRVTFYQISQIKQIHLCEIEIFSANIAFNKPVGCRYALEPPEMVNDGDLNTKSIIEIGKSYWLSINLLAYYTIYGLDCKFNFTYLNLPTEITVGISTQNPSIAFNPLENSFCAEINSYSSVGDDLFRSLLCPKGGVDGQFVNFYSTSTEPQLVDIYEIEIFGLYLRSLYLKERNLLLNKPAWSSSSVAVGESSSFITDGVYTLPYKSIKESNPWSRIDMFKTYRILFIAIVSDLRPYHKKLNSVSGLVTNNRGFDINQKELFSQVCFTNTENFLSGEYRGWTCDQPLPVGRYVVVYLPISVGTLIVREIEAYGEEVGDDDNFSPLPILKADRYSKNIDYISSANNQDLFPLKAIDGSSSNLIFQSNFISCSEFLTIENVEARFTVYLNDTYLIYQIGVLLPSNSGNYCLTNNKSLKLLN
ncbi:DgyrCDS9211 [Dimorphilus gyrociliatus]|uniref:DgyrCDS9211 n=2 Tax=Dimorphilus gyrociliatus TaxID=2664684 RepID=A0A7I8VYS1_9ANNE|nr:DgyrCDS9211 [Dimorphilus gyrociliatus]